MADNVVLVDGRLSIKEEDDVKIVANTITLLNVNDVGADLASARWVAMVAPTTTTNIIHQHNQPR